MRGAGSVWRPLLALVLCSVFLVPVAAREDAAPSPERRLTQVLEAIVGNQLDLALERVEALLKAHPNFRLAHLIRGDLLLARGRPLETFGNVAKTVPRERVEDLRAEALARLQAYRERPGAELVPRLVLQLQAEQEHVFIVDSQRSRLYVFENDAGRPRLASDFYVTLGKRGIEKTRKGDQKTPVGVYHVTANLPRQKLTDFYGAGAYPINYPNEWDKRLGRNGYGIWLHGVPKDTYSRPPRASDGCIVLSNADLNAVARFVQVGRTPVIIADEIEWSDSAAQEADRAALAEALDAWRRDWESRDTERYLSHYSPRFRSPNLGLGAWSAHKRKVNASKAWIEVGLSEVSMFRYPRERDFVIVSFAQDYRSNTLSNTMRKRQYWTKEGRHWKIIYEGAG